MLAGKHFDVKINGYPVQIDSIEDLRRLRDYIDKYISWLEDAPRINELTIASNTQAISTDLVITNPPYSGNITIDPFAGSGIIARDFVPSRRKSGEMVIDYAVRALGYLGGEAKTRDVIKAAYELGWVTTSKNEKIATRVFTIMVKQNSDLIESGYGTMKLTEAGWQQYNQWTEERHERIQKLKRSLFS